MRYTLEFMWNLVNALFLTLTNTFPATRSRRAISGLFAIVLIFVILVAGGAIIYFIVFTTGPTTSSTYP